MPHFRTWDNIYYDYHGTGEVDTFKFRTEDGASGVANGGECIDRFEFVLMESGNANPSEVELLFHPDEILDPAPASSLDPDHVDVTYTVCDGNGFADDC